jgi:cytochrome c1
VISKGIRMTGMPAWEYRLSAASRWDTVAFLRAMPTLTAAGYASLEAASRPASCASARDLSDIAPEDDSDADPRRVVLRQYACHGCHRIDRLVGPAVDVGPPLRDWKRRKYIAGVLPNTPENLVRWIRDPDAVSPGTMMPDLGVTEAHAREIASFLFQPKRP